MPPPSACRTSDTVSTLEASSAPHKRAPGAPVSLEASAAWPVSALEGSFAPPEKAPGAPASLEVPTAWPVSTAKASIQGDRFSRGSPETLEAVGTLRTTLPGELLAIQGSWAAAGNAGTCLFACARGALSFERTGPLRPPLSWRGFGRRRQLILRARFRPPAGVSPFPSIL